MPLEQPIAGELERPDLDLDLLLPLDKPDVAVLRGRLDQQLPSNETAPSAPATVALVLAVRLTVSFRSSS